jgi:hypothetical protein
MVTIEGGAVEFPLWLTPILHTVTAIGCWMTRTAYYTLRYQAPLVVLGRVRIWLGLPAALASELVSSKMRLPELPADPSRVVNFERRAFPQPDKSCTGSPCGRLACCIWSRPMAKAVV